MANYSTANYVKAQIWLNGEFQSAEKRFRTPAVFQLFNSTDARRLFPNYESLKTAVNRTIEANYFLRSAGSLVTTGITHNHTGGQGDSGTLTPSWTPYSTTWSMTLKQANNSTASWQELFNDNLGNKIADFAEGLDDASSAYLFNNRTGVNTAAVKGVFDAINDVYEITEATYGDEAMSITRVVMDINKYQGGVYDVVCDSISYTTFQKQAAQGSANSTNLSFQFMNVTFIHDPALAARAVALDVTYVKGFWLAVPRGTVAVLPWIPIQNRQGVDNYPISKYGSLMNPVDGLQYGIHEYAEASDGSVVNGQTQDVLTQYELSIFLAFEKAPLSTATATTIHAFALI